MIGHGPPARAFLDSWYSGRLHHGWLLAGPQGLGKAAFAKSVARFLLTRLTAAPHSGVTSLDADGDPIPDKLIAAGNHPELLVLERMLKDGAKDLARNITVDQVRWLISRMQMTIAIGHWRVIIIDAIDDLEPGAANALLKTLEEPPAKTLFLLVSHSPGRLLPTIRSRCRVLRFQPLGDDELRSWLTAQRPMADMRQIHAAVLAAGGIPGRALELVDGDTAALEQRLMGIASSGDPGNRLREALARDVAGIAGRERFRLLLDLAPRLLLRLGRERAGEGAADLLAAWDQVNSIGRTALSGSYDPAMVAFEIGNSFAALGGTTAGAAASPQRA